MVLTTVADAAGVEALVTELLSTARRRPHCVVTTQPGTPRPSIDVERLAADCADLADVTVVPTGDLTWRMAELLPDRCAVWGGAGRVYPPGSQWQTQPLDSPLRFVYQPADADRAQSRMLQDAVAMAAASGASTRSASRAKQVHATVQGVLAGGARALVRTADGAVATVSADLTLPGVPLDWYLVDGLRLAGRLDAGGGRLRVDLAEATPRAILDRFGSGAVTLALVRSASRQEADLLLHPAVAVTVHRADVTSNPRDLVSQLLGPGEVVPVRIVRDPQGRLRLRLHDIEDDEAPLPALPLIEGGPPWLLLGRDLVTAGAEEPEDEHHAAVPPPRVPEQALPALPVSPALSPAPPALPPLPPPPQVAAPPPALAPPPARPLPGPGTHHQPAAAPAPPTTPTSPAAPPAAPVTPAGGTLRQVQLQLDAARVEIARLRAQPTRTPTMHDADSVVVLELAQERAKNAGLRAQLSAAKREASDLRKRARAGSTARSPLADRDRFDRAEDWIRHEVLLSWIDRLDAADRRRHPLDTGWTIGPEFADSLAAQPDSLLRRVFRTVVDVVVGLAAELDGRELHQLRSGTGGDDPVVVRDSDGAICWRVAVERHTPSARRLHYWRTAHGVELSRVVTHDDYRP